ncbi:ABC transporter ATP-binding protein [Bosea sp. (in: a-proteobacteria)]|uniref:ABC transporter ATP-binding protein n=1 Tax=Bosea sp. (in: a-proteobacteria) TaxID=1871050 RepID=UPI00260A0D22|nr:ABC transporter ATP-binding protein [Bosea sp. (in: a-proteobacteria)]MCO5093494.1 ABC transporter ATP-binding protein [Bosea sp. (in: a-proteobacteria)]
MRHPLVSVRNLTKRFTVQQDAAEAFAVRIGLAAAPSTVHAVDDVSMDIAQGEVVGLVGESGSGKSTIGRMIAGLLAPSSGQIAFDGADITQPGRSAKSAALQIQMIFQDPMSLLNPRMRIRDCIAEAPLYHGLIRRAEVDGFVDEMLTRVGLDPSVRDRYPHQFSGGQRQRVVIARALAVNPRFLICDESIAALDVSIQAQVLNLFMRLRRELDLSYLFISHDLGVVEHISDRVVILYLGRVVEVAPTGELFAAPLHPYTRALLDEVPRLSMEKRRFQPIKGEIPSPMQPPPGCHFHTRCPLAGPRCSREIPRLQRTGARAVACHIDDGGTA